MLLFQNELSAATHLTSKLLKDYEKQVISDHLMHYISSFFCSLSIYGLVLELMLLMLKFKKHFC